MARSVGPAILVSAMLALAVGPASAQAPPASGGSPIVEPAQRGQAVAPPDDENGDLLGPGGMDEVGTGTSDSASASQVRSRSEFAGAPADVGVRRLVAGPDSGRSAGEWVAYGALFVPRYALWITMAPLRGLFWAYERYGLAARLKELLSRSSRLGLFPSADLEPGFGVSLGVGAKLRGIVGDGDEDSDEIEAWARFFGRYEQAYGLAYRTGDLFGERFELEFGGAVEVLDASRFFGFGSTREVIQDSDYLDQAAAGSAPTALDAVGDATSVDTRFDQTAVRVHTEGAYEWTRGLRSTLAVAYTYREFRPALDAPGDALVSIDTAFDTSTIPGFDKGQNTLYVDLETSLDTRMQPSRYHSPTLPATGWKLVGFAGYGKGMSAGDPSNFVRYGGDVQRWFDLFAGDRVLVLRGAVEGILGGIDDISFVDLPRLGGSRTLRGYPNRRFRDRISTLAAVEFRFPIARVIGGYVFFDTGGVWRRWADFDAAGIRHGAGVGIQVHTQNLFLFRVQIAGGSEGAVLNLSFNPSVKVQPRTTRN